MSFVENVCNEERKSAFLNCDNEIGTALEIQYVASGGNITYIENGTLPEGPVENERFFDAYKVAFCS